MPDQAPLIGPGSQHSIGRLTSPRGTRLFWQTASKPHVEHREYAGMYHEVHNDVGKEAVFKDIEDWLAAKF